MAFSIEMLTIMLKYLFYVYNTPINLGIKLDIFTSLFLSLRLCY